MLHVNVVTQAALAPRVLGYLLECEFLIDVVHLPGAAHEPVGDLITCRI